MRGNYKALHAIKGTIFLHGHMHSNPNVVTELGNLIFRERKNSNQEMKKKIDAAVQSHKIKTSNVQYQQDIEIIKHLVQTQDIEAIYLETDEASASGLASGVPNKDLTKKLQHL